MSFRGEAGATSGCFDFTHAVTSIGSQLRSQGSKTTGSLFPRVFYLEFVRVPPSGDEPMPVFLGGVGLIQVPGAEVWSCPGLTHTQINWQAGQQGVCGGQAATAGAGRGEAGERGGRRSRLRYDLRFLVVVAVVAALRVALTLRTL